MHVIGFVFAIGLMAMQQEEAPDLSPEAIEAIGDWEGCISSNVSSASQSPDNPEAAADGVLEYCRDQQRAARAAMSLDLNRRMGRFGEETANSLETILVMRARQNILSQIAASRNQ